MIKVILIAALVIAATATACVTTYTECATCTTPTNLGSEVCVTCSTGFSLPATQMCGPETCTTYIANCESCTGAVCDGCIDGYAWDATNSVCVSCTDATTGYTGNYVGCTSCTVAAKAITCTACSAEGYILDTDNSVCVNCGSGVNSGTVSYTYTGVQSDCEICTNTAKVLACTECLDGYVWDTTNSECVSCTATSASSVGTYSGFVAYCTICTDAANDQGAPVDGDRRMLEATALTCTTCATGYVWDATLGACASCSTGTGTDSTSTTVTYTGKTANCESCDITDNALTCGGCATGYAWDSTNLACASCVTGTGTSTGATSYTYTGFDANCATCSSTSGTKVLVCETCSSAYYLNFDNTCASGTGLDANCEFYAANPGHCVQCMNGLTTGTASNACVACPSNCDVCNLAGTTCSVCNTGYELSTTTAGTCKTSGANIIMPGFALLSIIFYYLF